MPQPRNVITQLCGLLILLLCFNPGWQLVQAAAASPLVIKSAIYNKNKHTLVVKVTAKSAAVGGQINLLHGDGGILKQATAAKNQTFAIPLVQLGQVPCAVEARVGNASTSKAVKGAPANCNKMPICKILSPASGAHFTVNTELDFNGLVKPKDKKANTFTYEWDFGGGVFDNSHPTTLSGKVKFVRDNSTYRVRFAATDSQKRRCEAAVEVSVGTPPAGLPPKVSEQSAPLRGSETNGDKGDLVVIPFQEWTMQHFTDMRVLPNGYQSFAPLMNNLNAYVFEKGSVGGAKPRFVGGDTISLQYSAASNPVDPAGANSINSTSQNWPLNADPAKPAPLMVSTIQKSDLWETYVRPATTNLWSLYTSQTWLEVVGGSDTWLTEIKGLPRPDEGYFPHMNTDCSVWKTVEEWSPFMEQTEQGLQDSCKTYKDMADKSLALQPPGATHGLYMPGVDNPYNSNNPQPLPKFDSEQQWHTATKLPITDISDDGRVNPAPLLRVEAVQKGGQTVLAKTDGTLTNSRDFHCRECHAKGQIAANPNAGYKKEAFRSSPSGVAGMADMDHSDGMTVMLDKPDFFSVEDIGGNPNSLFDQEYAAALNYSSMHQFYDGMGILDYMQKGGINTKTGLVGYDEPVACGPSCHMSALSMVPNNNDWSSSESFDYTAKSYDPNYSLSMHRFHAEMQYNADKTDIVRNEKGGYARFDWKNKTREANKDINPNSLFPIFDANGKQLPMEQNCLKCHAGHREQVYNDRMKTAGVTCFDCHGDMLAMGQAFPKNPAKKGSNNVKDYRIPWFDETDCGSCHVGTGNIGKDAANGFFSAGVKKRAFEDTDLNAITRAVDKNDPDAARFAVVPNYVKEFATSNTRYDPTAVDADADGNVTDTTPTKVDLPVYRFGKDQHGAVACAACHGAAHSVGPNRDPKANDNVTAIQLQGYPGQIYECNVCHTQDAFKDMMNSGSTLHYPNKDGSATVLAGPHNMHPVNDPYWWKQAPGDSVDSTPGKPKQKGGIKGGWHNDWAKLKGSNDEDQCAACHGTDHKGTRLSKVPVDRELITEKGKKLLVKAGTPISCDLCHSIEKSCTGSPAGAKCGTIYTIEPPVKSVDPGTVNPHAPVITSKSLTKGLNVGEQYSYQVTATQVDNLALTYSLVTPPDGMMIDPTSHLITWTAQAVPGDKASFKVKVTNSANEETLQAVSISVCVAPKQWSEDHGHCM